MKYRGHKKGKTESRVKVHGKQEKIAHRESNKHNPCVMLFTRVLLNRIKEHVNLRLQKEQARFHPNCSCIDEINTLQIIIEQNTEWSSCLYTTFVDFEKAFDSINRKAMWKKVEHYGVPTQIVSLIKETYWGYAR
jgi:hypothetical protein